MAQQNYLRQQSEIIDFLRFPLIMLVVFVHMAPLEQQHISWDFSGDSVYGLISEVISHHIGQLAVPFFFLFSGYFFCLKIERWNSKIYGSQLRTRIKTLLIPYLFWNLLIVVLIVSIHGLFLLIGRGENQNLNTILDNSVCDLFWNLPINLPLWYLRDLMVMVLLSPVFFYFFRWSKSYGVLAIGLIYLFGFEIRVPGLSSAAFMYFGMGSFIGLRKANAVSFCDRYGNLLGILALTFLALDIFFIETTWAAYFLRLFIVCAIPAVFSLAIRLHALQNLRKYFILLSSSVFFIYAAHTIYILDRLKSAYLKTALATSRWGMVLGYFMIPFFAVALILLLYYALRRFLPKTLSFITGRG